MCYLRLSPVAAAFASNAQDAQRPQHIYEMHQHTWFVEVLVASVLGWVIGTVKGFSGTKEWMAGYWSSPPGLLIFMLDFAVFVGAGAYLGTAIYDPATLAAAFAAGVSWPLALGGITTGD